MELEAETLRRMAKCFGGRTCCRCGHPAERLARNHFYCRRHFPGARQSQPVPRVYRCHLGEAELAGVS